MSRPFVEFIVPTAAEHWAAAGPLLQEYAEYTQQLSGDLPQEDFAAELAALPQAYPAPNSALVLATVDGEVAGCCALRPLSCSDYPDAAEMKRLYVRKPFRRFGLGRELADIILDQARVVGYRCVLLDTLSDMEAARALYADLGFQAIAPYHQPPRAGAHYFKVEI